MNNFQQFSKKWYWNKNKNNYIKGLNCINNNINRSL